VIVKIQSTLAMETMTTLGWSLFMVQDVVVGWPCFLILVLTVHGLGNILMIDPLIIQFAVLFSGHMSGLSWIILDYLGLSATL
jgi:hypothetical protein